MVRLRRLITVVALGAILLSASSLATDPLQSSTGTPRTAEVAYRNTAPNVAYVGSSACAACHKDIYDDYVKTDMGRSMSAGSLPAGYSPLDLVPKPVTIYSKQLNRYFEVSRQGSDIYQSEYELDAGGREVFRNTQKIEYVIGSGANGFGCLVRPKGYLFEAPLSYFAKTKGWGLSPGFERGDFGFNRPILAACIACHSGLAQPVPGRNALYRDPPFREITIGCENCHGPGELHVRERMAGAPLAGDADGSIVNPAQLPSWLADQVCMSCHQGGDARVLQPGKSELDFRPGTPLDATLAIYKVPLDRNSLPQSDLLEHYSSMILSKCYRASGGRLSCLSCHNPHHQPTPAEALVYYRNRCLSCHSDPSCALPLAERLRRTPPNDCAGCHLPKREVPGFSHAALTNHRIVTRPAEPYPKEAFEPGPTGLIHLDEIPGTKNLPSPTLLEAYTRVVAAHPDLKEKYVALLIDLAPAEPNNVFVLEALAREAVRDATPEEKDAAIHVLSRAVELGSTSPLDYLELGNLLAGSGRMPEAIRVLKQGIDLAPYVDLPYLALAKGYLSLGKQAEAEQTMSEALRLFPQSATLREFVKKARQH